MKRFTIAIAACGLLAAGMSAHAREVYGDPKDPVAGEVLGTVVRTKDAEELRYVVLGRLTDRYAAERGIKVTAAEKDAYIGAVQDRLNQDRALAQVRRHVITRELATKGLTEAERQALTAELDAVNRTLDALGEPEGKPAEIRAAREVIAAAFIRQWKINRALHQQHGGRVIFQQGGPEPLDAYRKFLEAHQARGDFRIADERLEPAFWRYYTTDEIHSFYPPGSREEARAFASPPWAAN